MMSSEAEELSCPVVEGSAESGSSAPAHPSLSSKFKQLMLKTHQSKNHQDDQDQTKLKKEFTVLSGVGIIAGNIIGSGIFITPSKILEHTGSFGLTLIAWVIGGLIALAGGLCFIELGVVVRKSGGEYPIIRTAYSFKDRNRFVKNLGKVLAFVYTWSSVLVIRSLSAAILLLTCAKYLSRPFYINCDAPMPVVKTLALALLIVVGLINVFSVKHLARVLTVMTILKVLALVLITVVGVVYMVIHGLPSDLSTPFIPHRNNEPTVTSVALGLYGVAYAYDGWNIMNYAIEETKNFEKTLPRSLFVAIPMVVLCYLLVNLAYFGVLCYDQILSADTIALTFGYETLGTAGLVVIPLLVALSTLGSVLATMFAGTRLIFVAARDGLLPEGFSGLHRSYKTPVAAVMLMVLLAFVGIMIGNVSSLLDGYNAVSFVIYAFVFAALLIMRVTHKEAPRPFKAWFIVPVAVVSIMISVFLVVFPVIQEPLPCLTAFALLLSGLVVYPLTIPHTPWKKYLNTLSQYFTQLTTALLNTQIATEETIL